MSQKLQLFNKFLTKLDLIFIGLNLIQILPFLFLCVLCSPFIIIPYLIFKQNIFSFFLLRVLAKIYLFSNGIYLTLDEKITELPPSIIISNTQYQHETLLLLSSLPLKKIGLWPKDRFKEYLKIAGFLPVEYFSFLNFKKQTFLPESFMVQNYYIFQTVRFKYAKETSIPYALMLAIKNRCPFYIVDFENVENYPMASLLWPRIIKMKFVVKIEYNEDTSKMVQEYQTVLSQNFN